MNECIVRFSGLDAGYGNLRVLRGLEGTFRPGALTALIGPNGSGKSTLLKTLAGLLPYGGSLTFGTESLGASNIRELARIPRREVGQLIGVVPQEIRMVAPFTVYDAVALGRLPRRGGAENSRRSAREEDRLILEAVARVDLEHLLFREVTRISAGEAQRVLLATVLAQDPPVLLLDEPVSALDPYQTAKVFSLLRQLARSGKTVVVTAHDVNLAITYADVFWALKRPGTEDGEPPSGAPIEELNEKTLERIYGAPFEPYVSSKGAKVWHVRVD
jgi:iron complex transport system ATP-binding protein